MLEPNLRAPLPDRETVGSVEQHNETDYLADTEHASVPVLEEVFPSGVTAEGSDAHSDLSDADAVEFEPVPDDVTPAATPRSTDEPRSEAEEFLAALIPADPSVRRRAVTTLLRGILTEKRGTR